MGKKPVITAAEAAKMVQDGMTFTTSGFVASAMPEALNKALEQRFLESGSPKDLTLFYAAAQGNRDGSGADHFAHEGMLKRVIGGHYNMVPELGKLINADKLEAYNLPQGTLSQLYRDIAGHKVGHITHVGLNTFADPRIEGGKLNRVTTEDIVEVVEVLGEERLLYKALKFDIGFIRGSYADENGNVTLEHECCTLEATSIAQAVKNSGGKVVVQVEKVVQHGDLDPKLVKIPGIYVDAIVVCENKEDHAQCQGCEYDGSMTGDFHVPLGSLEYPHERQEDHRPPGGYGAAARQGGQPGHRHSGVHLYGGQRGGHRRLHDPDGGGRPRGRRAPGRPQVRRVGQRGGHSGPALPIRLL